MRNFSGVLLVILFAACSRPDRNEIIKIELVRSGAWSNFGAVVSVDSSLNYKYYARNLKQGYFIGTVSKRFWDTLNTKLEQIQFKTLPSDNINSSADAEYFELIIYWEHGKRTITKFESLNNNPVDKTFIWLNDSYKNIWLQRVKNPIKFESAQPNLPPSPSDSMSFLPPKIKR